jgi:hypothetical protein
LQYLQDLMRRAGGTPVVSFLAMQGLNAVISCSEWSGVPNETW